MKPHYNFKVLDKATEGRGELGVAWLNPDGTIDVQLNPCVVLHADSTKLYKLFPNTPRPAQPTE